MIILGKDDDNFSIRLATKLGCDYAPFRSEYHADGEPCPRVLADYKELDGQDVVVVLRGEQRPDDTKFVKLIYKVSDLTDNLVTIYNVKSVDVVLPYYWLCRQDVNPKTDEKSLKKERDKGKNRSCEFLSRTLAAHGARRIITFNPHFLRKVDREDIESGAVEKRRIGGLDVTVRKGFASVEATASGYISPGIDIYSLSAVPALARHAKEADTYHNLLVLAPDGNASFLEEEFRGVLDGDGVTLGKVRLDGETIHHDGDAIDADGRDVLLLDDIFSTFGTAESGISKIRNARNIDAYAVHGVLPPKGHDRIKSMVGRVLRRVVTTNTIRNDYAQVDIMPDLAGFFRME